MSPRMKLTVEVAIVLLVAAAVQFVPGGQNTADAVSAALVFAFGVGILWVSVRAYREHKNALYALGDRRRALLYGAVGVLIVTVIARPRLWLTATGEFVFWVIVGLAVYIFFALYWFSRSY
ncbi:MAG: hypothetical protein KGJ43_08000 [Acidobacteriota bacterium]|nr:hypothetical protein [Acidobacteriota bacterium]